MRPCEKRRRRGEAPPRPGFPSRRRCRSGRALPGRRPRVRVCARSRMRVPMGRERVFPRVCLQLSNVHGIVCVLGCTFSHPAAFAVFLCQREGGCLRAVGGDQGPKVAEGLERARFGVLFHRLSVVGVERASSYASTVSLCAHEVEWSPGRDTERERCARSRRWSVLQRAPRAASRPPCVCLSCVPTAPERPRYCSLFRSSFDFPGGSVRPNTSPYFLG